MATRLLGTLARWNADRGFGFIAPDGGGADVFVHASDMSRIGGAPQVGWRMDFQVRPGKDGKSRAFDVQREGMSLARTPERPPIRPKREFRAPPPRRRFPVGALALVFALGVVAFIVHRAATSHPPASAAPQSLAAPAPVAEVESPFKCDGRTRCSQMNSCAEATYFIQHCPNTKMDGNRDGVPCEEQWCEGD